MTEMQEQVADFVARYGLDTPLPYRLLDLVSELGELTKELLKATEYGNRPMEPASLPPAWEDELGDVLFSLICTANATGVNLDDALTAALTKYRKRLDARGGAGSGK